MFNNNLRDNIPNLSYFFDQDTPKMKYFENDPDEFDYLDNKINVEVKELLRLLNQGTAITTDI